MRKKGENNIRQAGKIAIRPTKIMISRLDIESQTAVTEAMTRIMGLRPVLRSLQKGRMRDLV
jgi:hypothetical protein